ncbi:MAG: hypothetical protein RLZZ292_1539 [Bacteroidota bacterium]|jgi:hypothetical protein
MHLYKILRQEDIANIPTERQFQLEIYLPNAVIPIETHHGNCLIRAVGCSFPNLRSVDGNLSIDGAKAALPMLTEVEGNCNIHEEEAQVPLLQRVGEVLTLLQRVELGNLEYVGKKIKNKPNVFLPKLKIIPNSTYEIKSQSDIDKIPAEGGSFGVVVSVDNVTFPQEKIIGNIVIKAYNVSFPNLKVAQQITIDRLEKENSITFPKLEQVLSGCRIAGGTAFFPNLEVIEKHLEISWLVENVEMPKLHTVGSFNSNCNKKQLFFPALHTVRAKFYSVDFTKSATATYDTSTKDSTSGNGLGIVLKIFFTWLLFRFIVNCSDTSQSRFLLFILLVVAVFALILVVVLQVKDAYGNISDRLMPSYKDDKPIFISFPNLMHIGGSVSLSDDYPFPKLETIGTVASLARHTVFPNVKEISKLGFQGNSPNISLDEMFPNLEKVKETMSLLVFKPIEEKVETFFYKVSDNLCLSTKEFYLPTRWAVNSSLGMARFPLKIVISILKMRHSSFQNFLTREVEREWMAQEPRFQAVLSKLESKWTTAPKYTFEDVFKIQDRNLRRYCFNYIGVSTMMEALEAKRIASDGIELDYFKYGLEGNKIPFRKHNIFEVYEADVSKISELRRWGQATQTVYAVKCWCTSTHNEHWLWIEEAYKNDPLAAIASTFRIHEDVIPYIKCLKRQGDVLICEMKKEVIPKGLIRPLTKDEYFKLLVAET